MIIAFTGKLGSGKDTAGERMTNIVDLPCRRVSFAAPLKESAAALLDIPTEAWETYKNDPETKVLLQVGYKDEPTQIVQDWTDDGTPIPFDYDEPNIVREFTAREFLQRYGTESHRSVFGDDFWVEQASKGLVSYEDELIVITDCRFTNEADAIRRAGGTIVRVIGANEDTGGHVSESGLPDEYIHLVIENDRRDDNYLKLDLQLLSIAQALGLPVKDEFMDGLRALTGKPNVRGGLPSQPHLASDGRWRPETVEV